MAQPNEYDPSTDFSDEEANGVSGRSTVRTAMLDAELDNISSSVNQIIANLGLIQRDDGELLDLSVGIEQIDEGLREVFAQGGTTIRGQWLTATAYAAKDVVKNGSGTYICATAHASGVFATDLAALKWITLFDAVNYVASGVAFTPVGTIASTNVQTAIAEVVSDLADTSSAANGDALVGVKNPATGGLARTQHARNLEVIHLKDFALADGTDQQAGVAAALLAAAGKELVIDGDTFRVDTGGLVIPDGTVVRFQGKNAKIDYRGTGACFEVRNSKDVALYDPHIDMTNAGVNAIGIWIRGLWFCQIYKPRIQLNGATHTGILIETSEDHTPEWGAYLIEIHNPNLIGPGLYGIRTMQTPLDTSLVTHVNIYGGWSKAINYGLYLRNLGGFQVRGMVVDTAIDGYNIADCGDGLIEPGELSGNTGYGINWGTGNYAIKLLVGNKGGIGGTLGYQNNTNFTPEFWDQGKLRLYGSRSDQTYWLELQSQFAYAQSLLLRHQGGGAISTIMEAGDSVGVTWRGTFNSGGILTLEMLTNGPKIFAGAGNPENSVTAPLGSLYVRSNGSRGTSLYIKENGTGSTGWSPMKTDNHWRFSQLLDDFLGDVIADQWNGRVGSDAQCVAPAVLANQTSGAIRMTTGDDAAASMAVNGVQLESALNWAASTGGLMCEFRVKMDAITNVAVFVGLTDQVAALEMPFTLAAGDTLTSNATDAVGVLFDTAADTDNWWAVGVKADVDATKQNLAVAPVAATYETWRIEISTGGTATFFRNNVAIGTAMANALTAATQLTPVVTAFARAAASRSIDVDFVRVQQER